VTATETGSLQIECVRTLDRLSELAPDWERVQRRCAEKHVLLDYRWVSSWLRAAHEEQQHRILVLHRDREVAGIVPLVLTSGFERFPSRKFQIHTAGDYRYLALKRWSRLVPIRRISFPLSVAIAFRRGHFLFANHDPALYAATVHYLESTAKEWDLAVIEGLPQNSPQEGLLREAVANSRLLSDGRRLDRKTAFAELPDSIDVFLAAKSRHFRKRLKAQCRQASERFPELNLKEHRQGDIADGMDQLLALEELSWKARDERQRVYHIGPEERLGNFYRDVARDFAATDEASVLTMNLGERPIAAIFCVEREGVVAAIITYMDEEYTRQLTAAPMFRRLVELAIERRASEIDFNGNSVLINKWSTGDRLSTRLSFYNQRPYSRLLRAFSVSASRGQRILRSVRTARSGTPEEP
jgi:CelD/BcsL family acetyltransferase involved in cellulose biosynthesis